MVRVANGSRPLERKDPAFLETYGLDPNEFLRKPDEFASFNEFFYRELKPQARPIDPSSSTAVFPADGRHLCVPNLSACDGLFVKGEMFSLASLVDDSDLADRFAQGSLLLSRLCPVDYHRFHFPVAGTPGEARLINGRSTPSTRLRFAKTSTFWQRTNVVLPSWTLQRLERYC